MTRTPIPQLSHADRRAQLDALMANYTGPITHLASVKLSRSGVRRLNQARRIVVVSVPLKNYRKVPVEPLTSKIVIDTDNYYPERDGHIAELAR